MENRMYSSPCPSVQDSSTERPDAVSQINYIAYAVLAMVIVAVGIVGNVLNLVVLSRPKLKGVMYVYLLGLAVSNLCVLLTAIPALLDIAGEIHSRSYATAFFQAHLELPLLNTFMASSVYIIICMTVNRYISIYKPTHFQRIHTFRNAYIAIVLSFVGGTVLHIPLAFEAEVVAVEESKEDDKEICWSTAFETRPNSSVVNHTLFRIYLWASELLLRLGPIVLLTILNALIIVRFRRIAMRREVLRGGIAGGSAAGSAAGQQHRASVAGSVVNVNGAVAIVEEKNDEKKRKKEKRASFGDTNQLAPPSSTSVPTSTEPTTTTAMTSGYGGSSSLLSTATAVPPSSSSPTRASTTTSLTRRASSRRRGLHSPEERMLVVVLIAIVVLFLVCTTPAAFLSILVTDELKKRVWFALFRACANNLELLCFALNFFVYCLCSADIRQAFVDVLCDNRLARRIGRRNANTNEDMGMTPIHVEAPTAPNRGKDIAQLDIHVEGDVAV